MSIYNPPHPGEFIKATYLEPFGYSCQLRQCALTKRLGAP